MNIKKLIILFLIVLATIAPTIIVDYVQTRTPPGYADGITINSINVLKMDRGYSNVQVGINTSETEYEFTCWDLGECITGGYSLSFEKGDVVTFIVLGGEAEIEYEWSPYMPYSIYSPFVFSGG